MMTSRWFLTVVGLVALGACTNEKIVFRTRDNFNPPPDTLFGFLGYFDIASKQTNCGNCHVEKQAAWKFTKHASAWADLIAAMANPPQACKNCHSVSQLGNNVPDSTNAGYARVADSSYHDVQCESCHGPGFDHAQAPNIANSPLARVYVSPDTLVSFSSATCAACHNDAHHPFVEQWAASPHSGNVEEVIAEAAAGQNVASCLACHEGRNTLKAWGVSTNYVEKNDPITLASAMPVTCAVCHDPHSSANEGQLRWPIGDPDPANNLCMKCHLRRVEPPATSPRGPHAPQGGVLLGFAGWWSSTKDDTILATHGNPAVNTTLCAGCHVQPFTVNDTEGKFAFQSVGHLFRPTPCLDANGVPVGNDCARPGDPGYVSGSRAFTGCQKSGCHNSAAQAEDAFRANRAVIGALADALWKDVDGDEVMYDTLPGGRFGGFDPGDTGLLTQLSFAQADSAFNFRDKPQVVTVAEGVFFNVRLIGEKRYANGDGSMGAHNPLLAQTLLATSIDELKTRYALPVPPAVQALVDQSLRHVAQARAAQLSSR